MDEYQKRTTDLYSPNQNNIVPNNQIQTSEEEQRSILETLSSLLSPEQLAQLEKPGVSRSQFLQAILIAISSLILSQLGPFAPRKAQAASTKTTQQEAAEHLSHDSFSLAALDGFGTLAFADSMAAIARGNDSFVQKFCVALGLPTYNTGAIDHSNGKHQLKFPIENVHLAAIMNVIRSSAFGPEVRKHTIHEFETTLMGVGLLMGLTSVARGIITSSSALDSAKANIETSKPEKVLADSIFQLTMISAVTQLPLSSFGNAAIGNQEFKEVHWAFEQLYKSFLPEDSNVSGDELRKHIKSKLVNYPNPVIKKNVERILQNDKLESYGDFCHALEKATIAHKHDLMTILMATSCDDAQAAAGDPGPLVGLWQKFGLDFLHAVPSLIPYTMLIGFERALFAAKRAGIQENVITKERFQYMKEFLTNTWKNLTLYFATVAPRISSKIAGTAKEKQQTHEDAGVDFSILEQVLRDIEAGIVTISDSIMGSFGDQTLDEKKIRQAIQTHQLYKKDWNAAVGEVVAKRIFPNQQEEATVSKEEVIELQQKIVGAKSTNPRLQELQIEFAKLSANPEMEKIEEFAKMIQEMRTQHFPELEKAVYESIQEHGKTPTITTIAQILTKNPKLKDLLDINYWHDRIGPALTDTLFVVLLQGLHLPFLINTSERIMYNAEWFKKLPLSSQEILSVLYNNGIGMFADNWADCVAHSNWMTTIYFNELQANLAELLTDFPEVHLPHFQDDTTALIPKRFEARAEQTVAFIEGLKKQYPNEASTLNTFLQNYLENVKKYYFKAMLIAMTISVVGAGKSLPGDSTHFTFAAGETDFTLAVTLEDFKRHPAYHVWELIFSGTYATLVGPLIAQHGVAPGLAKLGIGHGLSGKIDNMMKEQFHTMYPGFDEAIRKVKQA